MKIAVYHELHKGGARRSTNEFARQLKILGHTVDLYTIDFIKNEESFYSRIYSYSFHVKKWTGNNPFVRLYKDTVELIKLNNLNRKIGKDIGIKYDLVFVCASQFIESPFILKYLKVPSFFYCHDPYYRIIYEPELFKPVNVDIFRTYYENLNRYIRKKLDIFNIKSACHIIFNSNYTRRQFKKIYGVDGDVVHCGVNVKQFFPKKIKKEFDLLFIGSFDKLDGYPFFRKTIENMELSPKIRAVVFENEWLSDYELINVYRKSKILISVSYKEPMGMVPLEAMSCGVPVIAVDEAGHQETIVDSKTGYLLNRNAKIFAQKIDGLLRNENIIKKMGMNARKEMVERWDWKIKGKELEKLLISKTSFIKNEFAN